MIIRMGRPYANDYPDGPALWKWSSKWAGIMQMIIQMGRPFANDHLEGPAFCKWSYRFLPSARFFSMFLFIFLQKKSSELKCWLKKLVAQHFNQTNFFLLGSQILCGTIFKFFESGFLPTSIWRPPQLCSGNESDCPENGVAATIAIEHNQ